MSEEQQDRLASLTTPENRTINEAYSKRIKRLRLLLPLIAVVIFAVVLSWTTKGPDIPMMQSPQMPSAEPVPPKEIEVADTTPSPGKPLGEVQGPPAPAPAASNELLNPKFESRDKQGHPYIVTAAKATLDTPGGNIKEGLIILDKPSGEMQLGEGRTVSIKANTGSYHQNEDQIKLSGDVVLEHSDGYQAILTTLNADLKNSVARSSEPVQAYGPEGSIQAKAFILNGDAETLNFQGPVKVLLDTQEGFGL